MHLHTPLVQLTGVGEKQAKTLQSMGVSTVADLLQYFPTRYLDFSKFVPIASAVAGEVVTISGTISSISSRFSFKTRKTVAEATVTDATGKIHATWFNQGYIATALQKGDAVLLSGKVNIFKDKLQLVNPIYEKATTESIHTGRLVPIYKLPEGMFPKTFRKLVHAALPVAKELEDAIPKTTRDEYSLPTLSESIQELHFPKSEESVQAARHRMAFFELLVQQMAVLEHKKILRAQAAPSIDLPKKVQTQLTKKLPFRLTEGQQNALTEIVSDLAHKHPMNRLLQGDVGSGKTIVALLAAVACIMHGYQALFVAPTEVLARQHFLSLAKLLETMGIPASALLYSRSFKESSTTGTLTKKAAQAAIASGEARLIVATHAILQEDVQFAHVALVVIDEQHRFGVGQRAEVIRADKNCNVPVAGSSNQSWTPHLLSMSATPIPRTAALALCEDLDISTIPEPPKHKLPIKTWVVPEAKRAGSYDFITKEIDAGHQAFIVTPLVEESEKLAAKAAKAEFERLAKEVFTTQRLGLLYGTMKGVEKEQVMAQFAARELDILVCTSVIEVGIDIPNATVIVIENADRFGLAQLHQLRGRVGRGSAQSYCFLFSETTSANSRLNFFSKEADGFALAKYDMEQRGFGTLFSSAQTGFALTFGEFVTMPLLAQAKAAAHTIDAKSKTLPEHSRLLSLANKYLQGMHME